MKCFLLSLFLIPTFMFATMKEKESSKLQQKMVASWKQCNDFVKQLQRLDFSQDAYFQLIGCAVDYCQSALFHCNTILDGIGLKKKKEENWRQEVRLSCEENKKLFERRLNELKQLHEAVCFQRAAALYQHSQEVADAAAALIQCRRRLDNVEEAVSSLKEASLLYNQAASLAENALQWIIDSTKEADKAVLIATIANHREAAHKAQEDALSWPERLLLEVVLDDLLEDY